MPEYSQIGSVILDIRERIQKAAARAGRDSRDVELMAVTKFHPLEAAKAAWEAGIRLFGESRVQEAEAKFSQAQADFPGLRLDLIGRLQSNKAKKAVGLFSTIQSVDSLDLIEELDRRARAGGKNLDIFLEMHTGEESKTGFPDLDSLCRACELLESLGQAGAGGLQLKGLMTMAPYTTDEALIRASFRCLARSSEGLAARFPKLDLSGLSMGMSSDFELAVEEGSTLVRIGTGIFGPRPQAQV